MNPDDPFFRAAASMKGKPGAIDPVDAEMIQRSYRAADHLERAGFEVQSPGKYPRGVNVLHHEHMITLTPNEGGGWHARLSHPDDMDVDHRANLAADEARLPGALRVHLARADVRAAMRRPR